MDKKAKIYIAGHNGMLGSALTRLFIQHGYTNLLVKNRSELDLTNETAVRFFFKKEHPDYVILAAAKVGGIQANLLHPDTFLYENIQIQNNVIHNAHLLGVKKMVFMGSSCIYPRECPQPMKEEYLLSGYLEPTNEGYALAKIVGLKLIEYLHRIHKFNGICPMPSNLYGTNDSFHPEHAHVLSSLVRRFVDAVDENLSEVKVWGTGIARREFMHVDDAAKAVLFLMENHDSPFPINVGCGIDYSIKELAEMIADKAGFKGKIIWDTTRPDGMPRKCMEVSKLTNMGFIPTINLETGIIKTISEYVIIKKQGKI
jgi:GDP-L-fucose synthase